MEVSCVVDSLAFVGDLKAALAHTEVHGIHVNFTWIWFVFSWLSHVC